MRSSYLTVSILLFLFACGQGTIDERRFADAKVRDVRQDAEDEEDMSVDAVVEADATPDADLPDAVEDATPDAELPGPTVDRSDPQLYDISADPDDLDSAADNWIGTQSIMLDTRVPSIGKLVVLLHGAGGSNPGGMKEMGRVLTSYGFHVVIPAFASDYGVGNCGDDKGDCRLEALEGVDHTDVIEVSRANSIEGRVVKLLEHAQTENPKGDWDFFLDGANPKWEETIVSGSSHGASSSFLISKHRMIHRAVALSGPLDTGSTWLTDAPLTPLDRLYAFTHQDDDQHDGHIMSLEVLNIPGEPVWIEDVAAPYNNTNRLRSKADTSNGHGSTKAGSSSPKTGDDYDYDPAWRYMYGVQ